MIDYIKISEILNEKCKRIIQLIELDYGKFMSYENKCFLKTLESRNNIEINKPEETKINGISIPEEDTFAYGGRTFSDNRIHFFLYRLKNQYDTQEYIKICEQVMIHEIFHYFIRPDIVKIGQNTWHGNEIEELSHFFTEGLVELFAREFYKKHMDEFEFEMANYGYNVLFAQRVLDNIIFEQNVAAFNMDILEIFKSQKSNSKEDFIQLYHQIKRSCAQMEQLVMEIAQDYKPTNSKEFAKSLIGRCKREGNTNSVIQGVKISYKENPEKSKRYIECLQSCNISNYRTENNIELN